MTSRYTRTRSEDWTKGHWDLPTDLNGLLAALGIDHGPKLARRKALLRFRELPAWAAAPEALKAAVQALLYPDAERADKGAAHDVSGEARDQHGEWTAGAGDLISPHDQAPERPTTHPLVERGRGTALPDNPLATQFDKLTPKLRGKIDDVLKGQDLTRRKLGTNLESLWNRMQKESPDTIEEGKHWYEDAHGAIQEKLAESKLDLSPRSAIGVTAALSPQNEWGQNIAGAGFLMKTAAANPAVTLTSTEQSYLQAKAKGSRKDTAAAAAGLLAAKPGTRFNALPTDQAAWATVLLSKREGLRSDAATSTGKHPLVAWSCGTAAMDKAIQIQRGAEPADVLGGHKVRSFFNNLADPTNAQGRDDVTIDTHAVNASALTRMAAVSPQLKALMGAPSSRADNVKGSYSAFADAFRGVAANHGLNPDQAQASLWLYWQKVRLEYPNVLKDETVGDRRRKGARYGVQHADPGNLEES